ncbi:MAG: phosphotransferase [Caulobacterales bacterium]
MSDLLKGEATRNANGAPTDPDHRQVMAALLRLMQREVTDTLLPEISTQYPTYVANLMAQMLGFMADWTAGAPYEDVETARRALADQLAGFEGSLPSLTPDFDDTSGADTVLAQRLNALAKTDQSGLLASIVPAVAAASDRLYTDQSRRHAETGLAEREFLARVDIDITPALFDRYAREKLGITDDATANVIKIPGGHSKDTFLIEFKSGREMIIRRDFPFGPVETSAPDEFTLLSRLHARGIPVPRPLAAEYDRQYLAQPFLVVERVQGRDGHETGLNDAAAGRKICVELARLLAKLHSYDPIDLGLAPVRGDPQSAVRAYLESWRSWWRKNQPHNSSLLEAGFAWLERNVPSKFERVVTIHGDARPGNMLFQDGEVTALLDWEFFHAGDPAEDLLYAKIYVEPFIKWDDFIAEYQAAGGAKFSAESQNYYDVFATLRNVICTETAWGGYIRGKYPAFKLAAQGVVYKRMLAHALAKSLQTVPW